jgi:hypothetical protein
MGRGRGVWWSIIFRSNQLSASVANCAGIGMVALLSLLSIATAASRCDFVHDATGLLAIEIERRLDSKLPVHRRVDFGSHCQRRIFLFSVMLLTT